MEIGAAKDGPDAVGGVPLVPQLDSELTKLELELMFLQSLS